MKKFLTTFSLILGAFIAGFLVFYFLMPQIVRFGKVVSVPDLRNLTYEDAKSLLASLSLKSTISDSIFSSDISNGRVVSQRPPPLSTVKVGRKIFLTISRGPKKIKIPQIKGLKQEEVEGVLDIANITNRVFILIPSDTIEEGYVISSSPPEGDDIVEGARLKVFVSKGKTNVFLMPNLIGLSLSEAEDITNKYELVIGNIKYVSGSDSMVLLQSPMVGVEVSYGDTITLVVGKKKE